MSEFVGATNYFTCRCVPQKAVVPSPCFHPCPANCQCLLQPNYIFTLSLLLYVLGQRPTSSLHWHPTANMADAAAGVDLNDNAQGALWAITIIMLVLATLAVVVRIWSVLSESNRKFGLDDLFVALSLVSVPCSSLQPLLSFLILYSALLRR